MTRTVNLITLRKAASVAVMVCVMLAASAVAAYADGYHRGPSGFSFASNSARTGSSGNGYSGASGSINRPHRGDWMQKLNAQRQYEDYLRKQAANSTAACGFTGAPNYCYRLVTKPRYPAEYRVVRY